MSADKRRAFRIDASGAAVSCPNYGAEMRAELGTFTSLVNDMETKTRSPQARRRLARKNSGPHRHAAKRVRATYMVPSPPRYTPLAVTRLVGHQIHIGRTGERVTLYLPEAESVQQHHLDVLEKSV